MMLEAKDCAGLWLHGLPGKGLLMGFYASLFFRSWLVVARTTDPSHERPRDHSLIVLAASEEEAVEKVRRHLTAEGFQVGAIDARFG